MPEGKIQSFSTHEYPKLEGLEEGSPVMIQAEGKVVKSEHNQVDVKWDSYTIETENKADKELKSMKGERNVRQPDEYGEDDF